MNSAAVWAALITSLGLGGGIVAVINGVVARRKVGADATVVVIAAARELVDPLRKELALERSEHEAERAESRRKAAELRAELERVSEEVQRLRKELTDLRVEAEKCRTRLAEALARTARSSRGEEGV